MPKPTVGRAVHVVPTKKLAGEKKGSHWAATVSETTKEGLTLFVMHPAVPDFFLREVQEDQTATTPGTWHWPEREE